MSDSKYSLEELLIAHTDRIEKSYKELDTRLDGIEKVIIKQEINLKMHMKRSDLLEQIVNTIRDTDLKPIQRHINYVEGGVKLIGLIALIVGIVGGIIKILGI